eukprot:30828-Pelagococcus_subviridis.AAC.8
MGPSSSALYGATAAGVAAAPPSLVAAQNATAARRCGLSARSAREGTPHASSSAMSRAVYVILYALSPVTWPLTL